MFNRLNLNGTWKLSGYPEGEGTGLTGQANNPEIGPIDAVVPGEVHPALQTAGIIPDPYYGMNAEQVQWVEEKEWWYTVTFNLPEKFVKRKTILEFDGLDTYATVFLNGQEIGWADNMFMPHSFDVGEAIRDGAENVLSVRFDPTVKVLEKQDCSRYFGCFNQERVNSRKQQCSFGWDWTHRFVGAGIWRDVNLVSHDQLTISDVYVQPVRRGNEADAWIYITVDNFTGEDVEAQFVVIVAKDENSEKVEFSEIIPAGGDVVETVIRIEDPELWYPNGMGDQPLYVALVGLSADGEIQDVREELFGVRTVQLVESTEQSLTPQPEVTGGREQVTEQALIPQPLPPILGEGEQLCGSTGEPSPHPELGEGWASARGEGLSDRFTLQINGEPVYCKGANWIPADHFPSRVTPQRYEELLKLAADANFNMLRVWGGGIYEDSAFYRLCDQLGIMVWQDFMFACASYPDDPEFAAKVAQEAEQAVISLRNHPSVVLWCGNNENEMNADPEAEWPGKRLFHEVIPEVVARLDGTRPYRPSSPYGGRPANSPDTGDWHGGSWFDVAYGDVSKWRQTIEREKGLFVSEFPTQGPPAIESVKKFIPEDQLFPPTLPVWEFYNKDNPHSGRTDGATHQIILARFVKDMMGDYSSAEEFCSKGGLLQGEFLKAEIEHYRRNKWQTSGCLFWMYNDCWPAISWSVVDYYLTPKVSYYYTRRAYEPIIVSFAPEDDGVSAWVVNDVAAPVHGTLEISLVTFGEGTKKIAEVPLAVGASASAKPWSASGDELGITDPKRQCLIARLMMDGVVTARNVWFFDVFSNIEFPKVSLRVRRQKLSDTRHRLLISAEDYARSVVISGMPSSASPGDNYFDVFPGEEYEVIIDNISPMDASSLAVRTI